MCTPFPLFRKVAPTHQQHFYWQQVDQNHSFVLLAWSVTVLKGKWQILLSCKHKEHKSTQKWIKAVTQILCSMSISLEHIAFEIVYKRIMSLKVHKVGDSHKIQSITRKVSSPSENQRKLVKIFMSDITCTSNIGFSANFSNIIVLLLQKQRI